MSYPRCRSSWRPTTLALSIRPEVFRSAWSARFFQACGISLRRYRSDPAALRRVGWLLGRETVIGVFVAGERSPLGSYQGALPELARVLARPSVPVVTVGISGS